MKLIEYNKNIQNELLKTSKWHFKNGFAKANLLASISWILYPQHKQFICDDFTQNQKQQSNNIYNELFNIYYK